MYPTSVRGCMACDQNVIEIDVFSFPFFLNVHTCMCLGSPNVLEQYTILYSYVLESKIWNIYITQNKKNYFIYIIENNGAASTNFFYPLRPIFMFDNAFIADFGELTSIFFIIHIFSSIQYSEPAVVGFEKCWKALPNFRFLFGSRNSRLCWRNWIKQNMCVYVLFIFRTCFSSFRWDLHRICAYLNTLSRFNIVNENKSNKEKERKNTEDLPCRLYSFLLSFQHPLPRSALLSNTIQYNIINIGISYILKTVACCCFVSYFIYLILWLIIWTIRRLPGMKDMSPVECGNISCSYGWVRTITCIFS